MSAKGCWGAKLERTLFFLSEYLYLLSFHNFDTYTGLRAKQVEKRETVSFRPREDLERPGAGQGSVIPWSSLAGRLM